VLDTPIDESKVIIEPQPEIIIEDHMNMNPTDKTNDWLQQAQFVIDNNNNTDTNQAIILNNNNNNNNNTNNNTNDDEKTLNELLEQVAELDEIYTDHQIRRENMAIENELKKLEENIPQDDADKMDVDDNFDDAATYTSLQRAFKHPIQMAIAPPIPPRVNELPPPIIINPIIIDNSSLKRESKEDEKLPPLPPKRAKKLPELSNGDKENTNNENEVINSRRNSTRSLTPRPQSQIVIMKSTERLSPSAKKLPPTKPNNNNNCNTLPKQKKPGFFSKLFSRKKSKSDVNSNSSLNDLNRDEITAADGDDLDDQSSSMNHFDPNDPNRESIRSTRSLKPLSNNKSGKPVARSQSSVSGKRPPNLSPDVIHIPLKGDSFNSLPLRSTGSGTHLSLPGNDTYERASTASLHPIDRKTMSALQLADVPLQDGDLGLIAIADAQSLKNLCEGEYGIKLDPSVDLTEAEHYALYTSLAPHATASEFDENSCYYQPVEAGEILTPAEIAKRLVNNF
jgi:Rel/ankyrin family protein